MPVNSSTALNESKSSLLWLLITIPALVAFGFLIRLPLVWTDQAVLSGLIIACSIVAGRLSRSRCTTLALTVLSMFCTLRYGIWRWVSSITYLNHSGWHVEVLGLVSALLLLLAETYSVIILLLGFFQSARPLKRTPAALPSDTDLWPSIDVFVPTYNEPLEVVRPTVLAALGIDWPSDRLNVYILDDGRRGQFQDFAAECGAGYLTRFDNAHAKAGNINAALKATSGEYIAIFDCDHIATRSFLQVTMGWFFKDRRLAMVQTPHHFYSPDPFERNLNVFRKIPNEGALFYGVVQDGNDLWNATFFCGSCAVIKREALEQIGGIAVETVTEDAHTALRLQRLGWNTAYLGIPQAAGLATGSLSAHVGQRIRWARGMVQILRTENPLFASGLTLPQRLCYLNCVIHYLYAIPRLIFVSAPLVYLIFGTSNLYGYIWEIVAYAAPHLVLSNIVNARTQGDHRHSFWNEVYEMVLAPYILLPTTFALINPKWGKFNVTAKSSVVEESFFDWKIARPYLVLLALNVIGIAMAIPRYLVGGDPAGVLTINVVWAALNTLMLGACIAVAFESKQRRASVRIEAPMTATLMTSPEQAHHCKVIDLSEGGLALRSERLLELRRGQEALAVIRAGDDEYRFEVETVRTSQNQVHMRFLAEDMKHQRAITKLVYARADSWLDWTKDQKKNHILGSLVNVFGIGAHGLWLLPSLLIKRERKPDAKKQTAVQGKAVLLPSLMFLLLVLGAWHSQAQSAIGKAGAAGGNESSRTFQDRQTLSDLGHKRSFTLQGADDHAALSFVTPSTKVVDAAALSLRFRAGDIAANSHTKLELTLNDAAVTAIPLAANTASAEPIKISLPADLLVHDNSIGFRVRRECAVPCNESNEAGWVRIDTSSELETSGIVLALPNRLSMLPSPFFDPSIHKSTELAVVLGSQPDRPTLKAAGIVASWYGAMTSYRGSHFDVYLHRFPSGNAVVLALSNSDVASSLGLSGEKSIAAICNNPSDPYGKVLALVGRDSSDLIRLAQGLALNGLQVDADQLPLEQLHPAEKAQTGSPASWAASNSAATKVAGHLNDSLLRVTAKSPTALYFSIAPDLDFGTSTTVPLRFEYQLSGLGPDDHVLLSLELNGVPVTHRELSGAASTESHFESFAIPVSLLYASNTLALQLRLTGSEAVASDMSKVTLQVLPGTNLGLDGVTHFVRMPRLDLFASSGFPFTRTVDLAGTDIVVPATPTPAQIGLYLDAIAFLSAHTGTPGFRFELIDAADVLGHADKDLMIIGSSRDEAIFEPFGAQMILKPAEGSFLGGTLALPWANWLNRSWVGRDAQKQRLSKLLNRDAPPNLLMEEFESPFRKNRTVLAVATRSELDDHAYFSRLAEEATEGHVSGGLTLGDDKQFESFQLTTGSYTIGNKASEAAAYSWVKFHLYLLPLLLLLGAFIMGRWWEVYLEKQAARRLAAIQ